MSLNVNCDIQYFSTSKVYAQSLRYYIFVLNIRQDLIGPKYVQHQKPPTVIQMCATHWICITRGSLALSGSPESKPTNLRKSHEIQWQDITLGDTVFTVFVESTVN